MPTVSFKGIKAGVLNAQAVIDELSKAVNVEAGIHRKELEEPIATWKDPPKIETRRQDTNTTLSALTGPTGSDKQVGKFLWLDKGTRIRWALMSGDWKSKTSPGSFKSGRGNGKAIIVGKKAMQKRNIQARPGIKARGWTDEVEKTRQKPFKKAANKAVKIGAKNIAN